jgi:CRP/FNR family transcriptional regulator
MPTLTHTKPTNLYAILKRTPLFAKLRDAELDEIAGNARLFSYPHGNIIFHQNEIGRTMYIIVTGKVRIFKTASDGGETTTNIFTTGDVFGEFSIFDQLPRSASAKTLTQCDLIQFADVDFMRYLHSMPMLVDETLRLLTHKVRWTATIAEALAQYDATSRLVHILVLYIEQFGEQSKNGEYTFAWGLTQSDLASLLGVRREWLNQILGQWHKRKLLTFENQTITVHDLSRLIAEPQTHKNKYK